MDRVNLTLDQDTFRRLERYARRVGKPKARAAADVLREGLTRQELVEQRAKLARDYAAQREDAGTLLRELERGQLDLMGADALGDLDRALALHLGLPMGPPRD